MGTAGLTLEGKWEFDGMDKRRYFIQKVLNSILTIVLVTSFDFLLFRILPGNPARLLLPRGRWVASQIAQEARLFHLNQPLWKQFLLYWGDAVQLKFGNSFAQQRPVITVIWSRLPSTILLVGAGTVVAIIVGFVSGAYAGWWRDKSYDVTSTSFSMILYATPTLWVGLVLIMLFSIKLGWFPTGGMSEAGVIYSSWLSHLGAVLRHLFLPVMTFALVYIGQYQMIMRTSLIGVLNEDFVLTARAKGLSGQRVLWSHAVPNALLPTVTVMMMNIGFIVSGAILTETVFNWPGIGLLAYDSLMNLDYPVLQGIFLLTAVSVIIANLVADIMYYYFDPRVEA